MAFDVMVDKLENIFVFCYSHILVQITAELRILAIFSSVYASLYFDTASPAGADLPEVIDILSRQSLKQHLVPDLLYAPSLGSLHVLTLLMVL